jgi:hypothetical protein
MTHRSNAAFLTANPSLRPIAQVPVGVAGSLLGGLFAAAAVVRHGKPLHPRGVLLDAVVHRTGAPRRWDAAWLDEPGEDRGVARLSRAAGLPGPAPDVLGLAIALSGPAASRYDLLLASTGGGRLTRFALTPRRDLSQAFYGSLFPYASASGPVLLAAAPVRAAGGHVPAIPGHPLSAPLEFRLLAASPRGRWQDYALLRLTAQDGARLDPPVSFDPVLNPLPGLRYYGPLAQLREPAYAGARRRTARGEPRPADLKVRTGP